MMFGGIQPQKPTWLLSDPALPHTLTHFGKYMQLHADNVPAALTLVETLV